MPDDEAMEYTGPVILDNRVGEDNEISEIRTGPFWEPPSGDVNKVNVIRAIALSDGCPANWRAGNNG